MKYAHSHIHELLLRWLAERLPDETPDGRQMIEEQASFTVMEDFTPSGPGWCGDILLVVWGHIGSFDVFRMEAGDRGRTVLVRVPPEAEGE